MSDDCALGTGLLLLPAALHHPARRFRVMQATCSLQLRVLGRGLVLAAPRTVLRGRNGHGLRPRAQEGSEGESPDWEAELAIFKQRTLKPSVAELQRKIVAEKVDVGRVSSHTAAPPPAAAGAQPQPDCQQLPVPRIPTPLSPRAGAVCT